MDRQGGVYLIRVVAVAFVLQKQRLTHSARCKNLEAGGICRLEGDRVANRIYSRPLYSKTEAKSLSSYTIGIRIYCKGGRRNNQSQRPQCYDGWRK